jgi:hypothetical protein
MRRALFWTVTGLLSSAAFQACGSASENSPNNGPTAGAAGSAGSLQNDGMVVDPPESGGAAGESPYSPLCGITSKSCMPDDPRSCSPGTAGTAAGSGGRGGSGGKGGGSGGGGRSAGNGGSNAAGVSAGGSGQGGSAGQSANGGQGANGGKGGGAGSSGATGNPGGGDAGAFGQDEGGQGGMTGSAGEGAQSGGLGEMPAGEGGGAATASESGGADSGGQSSANSGDGAGAASGETGLGPSSGGSSGGIDENTGTRVPRSCQVEPRDGDPDDPRSVCAPSGDRETGDGCFSSADCAPGLACVGEASPGQCRPYCCTGDAACTVSGTHCTERRLVNTKGSPPVPVCMPATGCSLAGEYPCPEGATCTCPTEPIETACMVVTSDGKTSCVPASSLPADDEGLAGQACPCNWGHVCSPETDRCVRLCQTAAPGDVCGGTRCQFAAGLPPGWGVCLTSSAADAG